MTTTQLHQAHETAMIRYESACRGYQRLTTTQPEPTMEQVKSSYQEMLDAAAELRRLFVAALAHSEN